MFWIGPAQAACNGTGTVTITGGTSATIASYNPFGGAVLLPVAVTINNNTDRRCDLALSFTRTIGLPAIMQNGASSLQYTIESPGGATLLQTTGYVFRVSPVAANRVDLIDIPRFTSTSTTVNVIVPAGQIVAAGAYLDSSVTIGIYALDNQGRPREILHELAFPVAATVVSACQLGPPSPATLDFSGAINRGQPSGTVLTSTFSGVACTAPSRLRLQGIAMQRTPAVAPIAGFDSFIDWQAQAVFGNASVVLSTAAASSATSTQQNVASGAVSGQSIPVDIHLVPGNRLRSGSYTGVATVTIDPAL
jgi:hypothetical protein